MKLQIGIIALFLLFFSGCVTVNDLLSTKDDIEKNITQTKDNLFQNIEEGKMKIKEIQRNIEEKKIAFDKKIRELEDAKKALNTLFGSTNSPEEIKELQQKLLVLEDQEKALELENTKKLEIDRLQMEILERQKRLNEIASQKK